MKYLGILLGLLLGNVLGEYLFTHLGRPFDPERFGERTAALVACTCIIWFIDSYVERMRRTEDETED